MDLSRSTLFRKLQALTGQSRSEFIRTLLRRLRAATEMGFLLTKRTTLLW
jgi:hypothetical protein